MQRKYLLSTAVLAIALAGFAGVSAMAKSNHANASVKTLHGKIVNVCTYLMPAQKQKKSKNNFVVNPIGLLTHQHGQSRLYLIVHTPGNQTASTAYYRAKGQLGKHATVKGTVNKKAGLTAVCIQSIHVAGQHHHHKMY